MNSTRTTLHQPRVPGSSRIRVRAAATLWPMLLALGCDDYNDPSAGVSTAGGTGNTQTSGGSGATPSSTGGSGAMQSSMGGSAGTPSSTGGSGGTPLGAGAGGMAGGQSVSTYAKPRLIIQTDGEVDDRSTFVRFLMYSSDYDVVGIVQTNSKYQTSGHSEEMWVEDEIALYGQVLPNLKVHNPDYPEASALLDVVRVGNENSADLYVTPGSMETKETAGSKLMLDTMLNDDSRPLHIATWGGANTLAYALYTLKSTYPDRVAEVASKLWVYCIWYQDNGGQWIEDNVPEVHIYEAYRWDNIWDYQSLSGPSPDFVKAYMTDDWLNENVKTNHGPLGAYTPQSYVSEGDTPSWLALINNGLYQHMNYTWGGWGGRPVFDVGNHMTDKGVTADDGDEYKSFWRWIPTLQNDFAARMDWSVASAYASANHNPKAQVVGELERNVAAGETVNLDASPTTDPDGNNLTFKWWQYYDADSAVAQLAIANDSAQSGASFMVPSEPGKQVHVILEVTDDGTPPMASYQRIIFNIQ